MYTPPPGRVTLPLLLREVFDRWGNDWIWKDLGLDGGTDWLAESIGAGDCISLLVRPDIAAPSPGH